MAKKVLIIEDSPLVLNIFKDTLSDAGYEVVTAETGESGVAKAKEQQFDAAIIDTLLPGMNGFEACRAIRAMYDAAALKIIVMTGSVDAIDATRAREAGADDYCAKTSDIVNIVDSLAKLV